MDPLERVADLALLGLLQLSDPAFPTGAYTLSHGLESLVEDGTVRDVGDVAAIIRVGLIDRLARADLPALICAHEAAWRAVPDMAAIVAADRALLAVKLAREEREGSQRVGRRLLAEASRIESSVAMGGLRSAIEADDAPGNAAVVQGVVMAAWGIERRSAVLAAASGFVQGQAMAALRLGRIGHGAAQRVIREMAPSIVAAADLAATVVITELAPCAPMLDIAAARHETGLLRAFAS